MSPSAWCKHCNHLLTLAEDGSVSCPCSTVPDFQHVDEVDIPLSWVIAEEFWEQVSDAWRKREISKFKAAHKWPYPDAAPVVGRPVAESGTRRTR